MYWQSVTFQQDHLSYKGAQCTIWTISVKICKECAPQGTIQNSWPTKLEETMVCYDAFLNFKVLKHDHSGAWITQTLGKQQFLNSIN